jgi:hypothetical protein
MYWCDSDERFWLCMDGLSKYVRVPKTAEKLRIVLARRPKGEWCAEGYDFVGEPGCLVFRDTQRECITPVFNEFLKRCGIKLANQCFDLYVEYR